MGFFQKLFSWFIVLISMLAYSGSATTPEIKVGEFDFVLTYEVDGECETIEGTYVCKFERIEYYLDGISRIWTGYIKGHEESDTYAVKKTEEGIIKVYLDLSPQFFMSDPHYKSNENTDNPKPEPHPFIVEVDDPENEYLLNYYEGDDVKIISFEYEPPIENKYR